MQLKPLSQDGDNGVGEPVKMKHISDNREFVFFLANLLFGMPPLSRFSSRIHGVYRNSVKIRLSAFRISHSKHATPFYKKRS